MGSTFTIVNNPMLNALGLTVGNFSLAHSKDREYTQIGVLSLQAFRILLDELLSKKLITDDEVPAVFEIAVRLGLPQTWADVRQTILSFTLPGGHKSLLSFRSCECGEPIPHGDIATTDGILSSEQIGDIGTGFTFCIKLAESALPPLDLANIIKQMLEAGLPLNEEELRQRIAVLPEEQKNTKPDVN